jgi:glucosamine 6-phosphate synthetase-like amidotransferase/phosphosugar isomerase protein
MSGSYDRKAGTRAQRWILEGDPARLIEATGEHPIMYRNLGSEPRTAHPYHLYDDIRSQAKAIGDTFELNRSVIPALAARLLEKGFTAMAGHGLGTSQFVAQTASAAFWEWAGWEARDYDSLEYAGSTRPIDFTRTAFFSYSGSGATVDSNRAAAKARELGAWQVAVTSVAGSPITKKCEETVLCAGGFDTGGSDTFHYATRLAVSLWLALEIGALSRPGSRDWGELRRRLFALPRAMGDSFEAVSERARILSARYRGVRSVLIVGAAGNEGTAEEYALKYDEMSHIPAKGMCPGRHIHGALGLTTNEILTIVVAPLDDPAYAALRDVAQVTAMLKSPSIGVVSEQDEKVAAQVDDVFRLPERDPILFSVLAILPGQLLPYFAGVAQGDINPDCQRADIARHARVWNWLFPKDTH